MDFKEMDESYDKIDLLWFSKITYQWPEVYAVADRTASTVTKCIAAVI